MKREFRISLVMCGVVLMAHVGSVAAQGPTPLVESAPSFAKAVQVQPASTTLLGAVFTEQRQFKSGSGDVGCGWDKEFGTQAQTDCEDILNQLKDTYGIQWEAPTDPAIKMYDFNNRALRRWKLADAQALKDALDAWNRVLGGVDAAKRQLGLETLTFKLRGQRYMLRPGDLAEYIDEWNEIDLSGPAIQAVDFAHELAHRWERHHDDIFGQFPTYRTLAFTRKFFKGYNSKTDTWTSDGGGWTAIARGTEGHYNGARPPKRILLRQSRTSSCRPGLHNSIRIQSDTSLWYP